MTNFEKIHTLNPMELAVYFAKHFNITDDMENYFCKQCFVKHGYCRWVDTNEGQCMYDCESMLYDFLMEECDEEADS